MNADAVMIGLVILGIGLSILWFLVEYVAWRAGKAAALRQERHLRSLYQARVLQPQEYISAASVEGLDVAAASEGATYEDINRCESRRRAKSKARCAA